MQCFSYSCFSGPVAVLSEEEGQLQELASLHGSGHSVFLKYSNHDTVDFQKLDAATQGLQEAVVVLTSSSSSDLWLHEEHGPATRRLCEHFRSRGLPLRFVVSPTTSRALERWRQGDAVPDVFHGFVQRNSQVLIWKSSREAAPQSGADVVNVAMGSAGQSAMRQSPGSLSTSAASSWTPSSDSIKILVLATLSGLLGLKKYAELAAEVKGLRAAAETAREEWGAKHTSLEATQVHLAARNRELEAKLGQFQVEQQSLEARQTASAKKQTELEAEGEKLEARQGKLEAAQAASAGKEEELRAKQGELEARLGKVEATQAASSSKQECLKAKQGELEARQEKLEARQAVSTIDWGKVKAVQAASADEEELKAKQEELGVGRGKLEATGAASTSECEGLKAEQVELGARQEKLEATSSASTSRQEELAASKHPLEARKGKLKAGEPETRYGAVEGPQAPGTREQGDLKPTQGQLEAKQGDLEAPPGAASENDREDGKVAAVEPEAGQGRLEAKQGEAEEGQGKFEAARVASTSIDSKFERARRELATEGEPRAAQAAPVVKQVDAGCAQRGSEHAQSGAASSTDAPISKRWLPVEQSRASGKLATPQGKEGCQAQLHYHAPLPSPLFEARPAKLEAKRARSKSTVAGCAGVGHGEQPPQRGKLGAAQLGCAVNEGEIQGRLVPRRGDGGVPVKAGPCVVNADLQRMVRSTCLSSHRSEELSRLADARRAEAWSWRMRQWGAPPLHESPYASNRPHSSKLRPPSACAGGAARLLRKLTRARV